MPARLPDVPDHLTVRGPQLFGDLMAEANRRGFRLLVAPMMVEATGEQDGVAAARLEPQTRRARAACKAAHGPNTAAIEASAPYHERRDAIDATRAAARAALDLASEAGA